MKKGYITKYFNEQACNYDSDYFTSKREAMKKHGAKYITVVQCEYDSIYNGDNWRGWCTNDPNAVKIRDDFKNDDIRNEETWNNWMKVANSEEYKKLLKN